MAQTSFENVEGFKHVSQVAQEGIDFLDQIRNGTAKFIFTSSAKLNEATGGFRPSDNIVIAARPGVGKSTTANMIIRDCFNPLINPDLKVIVAYFSLEMPGYQQFYRDASSRLKITVKQLTNVKEPINDDVYEAIKAFALEFSQHPLYYRDVGVTVDKYMELSSSLQKKYPDFLLLKIFDHTRLASSNHRSEEERITSLMHRSRLYDNEHSSISLFLSQMNRNIESGKDRSKTGQDPPVLSDIFGSDAVGQYANLVIALHRPEMYNIKEYLGFATNDMIFAHILKQRDGYVGVLPWKHDLKNNRIGDLAEQNQLNLFLKNEF